MNSDSDNQTEVTVLLPVRDEHPDRLSQALEGILRQLSPRDECLIVDDGSVRPDTCETIGSFAQADSRISVVQTQGIGLTAALNLGLAKSSGLYVARHDSDDWSDPRRFAKQLEAFRSQPELVLLGSDIWLHQENGQVLWRSRMPKDHEAILRAFPTRNPFCHGAVMMRRSALSQVGRYDESLAVSQDYDLFWRLATIGRVANLSTPLYHLRRTAASISATRSAAQRLAAGEIRHRHGTPGDGRTPAHHRDRHADELLLAGYHDQAVRLLIQETSQTPWSLRAHARVIRAVLFVTAPPLRRLLFERRWP